MPETLLTHRDLIDQLTLDVPRPRKVRFSVEKSGIFWVVRDQGNPIAVVVRDVGVGGSVLDVLKFTPEAKDRALVLPPHDYHYATRLGYGASFNWSVDFMFQSPDEFDSLELVEQDESHLLFVHAGKFKDGSKLRATLRIGYDPSNGQYVYDMAWDVFMTRDANGAEFCNVFHRNLMHSDMRQREFDYGCYIREGSGWEKYPITIMVTGMQHNRLTGIPIPVGGGAGHMNRNGVVPMLVVRNSNVPIKCGSCDVCYDLHQTASVKAREPAHIEARFADVGPVVASDPQRVKLIDLDDQRAVAFTHGEVCDFKTTVCRSDPWSGGIWDCDKFPGSRIADDCGHADAHSMRLESDGPEVFITPYLSAFCTENHADYEMSAWVKVEGDERTEAQIELRPFRFMAHWPVATATRSVFGNSDWVQLRVTVNSGKVEVAMPYLRMRGKGKVWFDEVLVRKI